jgi:hypothetical protein
MFDFLKGGSDKDRFGRRVLQRLRARGWTGDADYDPSSFRITTKTEGTLHLDNLFNAWTVAQTKEEKERQIDIGIGHFFEPPMPKTFAEMAPLLLPAVRNRSLLAAADLDLKGDPSQDDWEGASRSISGPLIAITVFDRETSMGLLNKKHLIDLSTSFDVALERAIENLRAISPNRFLRDDRGFWVSNFGDHYDCSRLLLPHLFEQLELRGEPVAIAMSRTILVVAGSEDKAALAGMAEFVMSPRPADDRPCSYMPIVLREGVWSPFDTSVDGLEGLDALRVQEIGWEYATQKEPLQKYLNTRGQDLYVASLNGVKRQNGRTDTWTSWGKDISSLLPRADFIGMHGREQPPAEVRSHFCRWEDVETEFGPFPIEPHLYPLRYRVGPWPEGLWERVLKMPTPEWGRK